MKRRFYNRGLGSTPCARHKLMKLTSTFFADIRYFNAVMNCAKSTLVCLAEFDDAVDSASQTYIRSDVASTPPEDSSSRSSTSSSLSVVGRSSSISVHRAAAWPKAAASTTALALALDTATSSEFTITTVSLAQAPHVSPPSVQTNTLCPTSGTSSSLIICNPLPSSSALPPLACITRRHPSKCALACKPPGRIASGASTASADQITASFSAPAFGVLFFTQRSSSSNSWTSSYTRIYSP
mmetsp:Transcript_1691/g.5588  ORF Transcript_1691/g.5588 Transcript_1691/m.5588 type:complete len:240 (-) Transcript_1691:1297-2016(-)